MHGKITFYVYIYYNLRCMSVFYSIVCSDIIYCVVLLFAETLAIPIWNSILAYVCPMHYVIITLSWMLFEQRLFSPLGVLLGTNARPNTAIPNPLINPADPPPQAFPGRGEAAPSAFRDMAAHAAPPPSEEAIQSIMVRRVWCFGLVVRRVVGVMVLMLLYLFAYRIWALTETGPSRRCSPQGTM